MDSSFERDARVFICLVRERPEGWHKPGILSQGHDLDVMIIPPGTTQWVSSLEDAKTHAIKETCRAAGVVTFAEHWHLFGVCMAIGVHGKK